MLSDADLPPEERFPKGWRQLGCELAELQRRTDLEPYYQKLCEIKALVEADMEFLHPSPRVEAPQEGSPGKVIDLTHRGPGY